MSGSRSSNTIIGRSGQSDTSNQDLGLLLQSFAHGATSYLVNQDRYFKPATPEPDSPAPSPPPSVVDAPAPAPAPSSGHARDPEAGTVEDGAVNKGSLRTACGVFARVGAALKRLFKRLRRRRG
ncbi:hypothetical protein PENSPDRAFT_298446 [Peniophora sp. CONT]|nr:hypothetical protein PENSPDRAFT_298446 [Peniophora sp. CONT]